MDNNISYLNTPPSGQIDPPVDTRIQKLPVENLSWEDFEKLCLRLAREESNVEMCRQYGIRGDSQYGIDIFSRQSTSRKYTVYQSKNENNFGPQKIEDAVNKFIDGDFFEKSDVFVLCTRESMQIGQRSAQIVKQTGVLNEKNISFYVWDSEELSQKLKDKPDIVDDFFGREWVKIFCGERAASDLGQRLDVNQLNDLRNKLFSFYSSIFNIHDKGIPLPGELPLYERFVLQDIIETQTQTSSELGKKQEKLTKDQRSVISSQSDIEDAYSYVEQETAATDFDQRINMENWLFGGERSLLFGDPGSGKSSLLRYIALDVLNEKPKLRLLSEKWGSCIPIWIPFGKWTKIISNNQSGSIGFKEMTKSWFKDQDGEELIPLLESAFNDKRLLLLIDGLDEYSSSDSAVIAFNNLEHFINQNNYISIIASTRPRGFEKIGKKFEGWQDAIIAPLSPSQQKDLTKIWFLANSAKGHVAINETDRLKNVSRQVGNFMAELSRSKELNSLSQNPLLLSLLILFQISSIRLPNGRFKAYELMVEHLISTHPQTRRVAAETPENDFLLEPKQIKEAFAHLAFILHTNYQDGLIGNEEAIYIVRDFLIDDQQGLGMEAKKALDTARLIISKAEDGFGILVRKSQDEIGFFHRFLQEYLAAYNISRLSQDAQTEIIRKRCVDTVWNEVILGLFQITNNPNYITEWIQIILKIKDDNVTYNTISVLLSEIIFSDFNCPPSLAKELAVRFFDEISNGTWMPERKLLLSNVLKGLNASSVSDQVKKKLIEWFPDRLGWNGQYVINALMEWELSDDLLNILYKLLNSEDYGSRDAAAMVLAKKYGGNKDVEIKLIEIAQNTDSPQLSMAATTSLMTGWASNDKLRKIVFDYTESSSSDFQLIGVKGKVILNIHEEKDLDILLHLSDKDTRLNYWHKNDIIKTIIDGWSKSEKVKQKCLDSLTAFTGDRESMDNDIATQILILGYPMDDDVAKYIIQQIRKERHPFLMSGMDVFKMISLNFKNHAELIIALDEWVEKIDFRDVEVSYASLIGRTGVFKKKLIIDLRKNFPHWPARALLDGWGISDSEVKEAINNFIKESTINASRLGHLMPKIIVDKKLCREKLIEILRSPDCDRYDFVIQGLIELGNTEGDTEVVDIIIEILKNKDSKDVYGLISGLITHYNFDARVRDIAIKTLSDREGPINAVVQGYKDDEEIKKMVMQIILPLPANLRLMIATYLSEAEIENEYAISLLSLYDLEKNSSIKVQASIGFYSRIKDDAVKVKKEIKVLSKNIVCYGPDHRERRLTAFCGLVILNRLDVMISTKERIGDPGRLVTITTVEGGNINIPHVRYILKNWEELKDVFGDEFWERLFHFYSSKNYVYNHLAQFVDEYEVPKNEIFEYLQNNERKVCEAGLLHFLSRVSPKSQLLWEYCVNVLDLNRMPPTTQPADANIHITYRDEVAAIKIIGKHFGENNEYLQKIDIKANKYNTSLIQVLFEAWPHSKEIKELIEEIIQNKHRVSNTANAIIYCYKASSLVVYKILLKYIKKLSYQKGYMAFEMISRPFVLRIRKDNDLLKLLSQHLSGYPSIDDKITIPLLIFSARGLTPELRQWIEKELDHQLKNHKIEVGMNMIKGDFISVPHALLNIISSI